MYWNKITLINFLIVISMGCTNSTNEINELKKQTAALQSQIDSLKNPVSDTAKVKSGKISESASQNIEKENGSLKPGKHNFTLQWISWDEPGSVDIQPSKDGWYTIEGNQKNRKNADYITISGLIKQVSETELLFKGEIKSVIQSNNKGEPCIKTGSKIFKTTQNRKYWRLQDMINCEGGMLTDYVDIYF